MNKKKIGIITVHRNVNYGANLQAYASCKYLNNSGFDAEIIDYYPKEIDKDNYLFSWLKLSYDHGKSASLVHNAKLFTALTLSAPEKNKRLKSFYNFRKKYCKLSPKYETFEEIANGGYTDVVCGSDQIWNPDITKGINPYYFGDISGVTNKVSYAASIGKSEYNSEDEKKASELIKNIDYISVREEQSVDYVKTISGKKVIDVCDPVFLLPKEEYEKIAEPINAKKPYLLVYSVISNTEMTLSAKKYAEQKGLILVEICQNKNRDAKHLQLSCASPEELLGAVKDAEIVVTNSFHGTAFSIIFNKNFYVFDNKLRKGRISNLLSKAGLENRIVEDEIIELAPIDYNEVNISLKEFIDSSKEFLLTALKTEKKPITDNCIGCGACKSVCKADAVNLTKNYGGFIKGYIDTNKCVGCNLCSKVCPVENTPSKTESINVFAYKARDDIRKNSTSGGAGTALAEKIIKNNGTVYGASLDKNYSLKHIRIDNADNLSLLQGTKYIQSDMTGVFDELKHDLESGKPVLFTGTPCQVAGVKNYVSQRRIDDKNLYLCDIICHGVPSPKVFKDYINWLKDTEKDSIKKYHFRNKTVSWRGDSSVAETEKSEYIHNKNTSAFLNMYYSNNLTNDSCFNCCFTSQDRVSDLTISDFWGIEKDNPHFEDELGVSMVMVNTLKGKKLFDVTDGEKAEANIENAKQPQLKEPPKKPQTYNDFWKQYKEIGIEYAIKNFGIPKTTLKSIVYNLIKGK